ncbi:MAG: zinc ribbon domain-containing protein [Bacteroidota bacterium]
MFCPKCGATLKDGAKFCHSCGNTMGDVPVTPQPQQQQQTNEQQPAGPGFDISKTPMSAWIIAGAATLGLICTFLPWITIRGWGGLYWGGAAFSFRYLVFLIFLGIAGLAIFSAAMKMKPEVKDKIISFGGIGAGGFCFIDLLRSVLTGYLSPGFGLIIALIAAVGIILFGFKVIKLK